MLREKRVEHKISFDTHMTGPVVDPLHSGDLVDLNGVVIGRLYYEGMALDELVLK
jgi:hypothetical protein